MLLIKKGQFFVYLVLVKTRLVIRFNNVRDRKETVLRFTNVLERKESFLSTKTKFLKVPKIAFFPRG